jgi:hypothetical protein
MRIFLSYEPCASRQLDARSTARSAGHLGAPVACEHAIALYVAHVWRCICQNLVLLVDLAATHSIASCNRFVDSADHGAQ